MKLAKQLGIATVGVALSFAAVGAKPAQAASVVFQGQDGNRFDYTIKFDSANLAGDFERLRVGSLLSLSGLSGVTNVTTEYPTRLAVDTAESDFVTLKVINFALTGSVDSLSTTFGKFSIFSSATTPGLAQWDILRRNPLGGATAFTGKVTAPAAAVPEPFTVGGSVVAFGYGLWMKRKQTTASQKAS